LIALIADLPVEAPWHTESAGGEAEFQHVKASVDSEGAVYIDHRHMMVALDPEDAAAVASHLDARVERRNPTTWRVEITADDTRDPLKRQHALDAVCRSILRSADRSRREAGTRNAQNEAPREVCQTCFVELPVNGECEIHGRKEVTR
jgi:hypothetical protein